MITPVESIAVIRKSPKIYLPGGVVTGEILCARVASDILTLSGVTVMIRNHSPWWIVAADCDWVSRFKKERSVRKFMTTIVAFPERSDNDLHGEVIVAAFAKALVTIDASRDVEFIIGDTYCQDLVGRFLNAFPQCQRLLVFQM